MLVPTRSQTHQHKKTLPSTSEKMAEEEDNRHATDETEKLIEKELALQQIEMFAQFSDILMRVTSNSRESSMQHHYDKIIPFKVQVNLYMPNLEGKINVKSLRLNQPLQSANEP